MIDSTDEQIVMLMGQDARQNSEALAKKLNLSAATVRRRLRKLIHNDVLNIVGVVNHAKMGFAVLAVITLDIAPNKVILALEELAKWPQVRFVATTTGRFDIIIIARFRSTHGLSEFLTKKLSTLRGLRDSETFLCLEVKQQSRTTYVKFE